MKVAITIVAAACAITVVGTSDEAKPKALASRRDPG
jgi:hypothetical protein